MEQAVGIKPTHSEVAAHRVLISPSLRMAGAVGIEPTSGGLESLILPLNYAPIKI